MNNFTGSAASAIIAAENYSRKDGYLGTQHLLFGLLNVEGVAKKVLENNGIYEKIEFTETNTPLPDLTPKAKKIIQTSAIIAKSFNSKIGTEHILMAILKEDCAGLRIIEERGNPQKIYMDVVKAIGVEARSGERNTTVIDKFSKDITQLAKDGQIDPVIGRDNEINRVIQILSRRTKNNPCIIGEPGVGKTAIAEGLARKIVNGEVPITLTNKRLVALDVSSLVAGARFRGEFEERIKKVIEEAKNTGVLLFIDELHTVIGAGSSEGSLDVGNILKPVLARGEIQVIGATTIDEYRRRIERDTALERRFQPVKLGEPSEEDSLLILKGLREEYEHHHGVKITDEGLEAAVKLSKRYITDRFLPDKAIDLIDEAAAKARISAFRFKESEEIKALETQKEEAIKAENYEEASKIKRKQVKLQVKLNENMNKEPVVGENEIASVVTDWTQIPVEKLKKKDTDRLKGLEKELKKRIIGQEEAVKKVSNAIKRSKVGLSNITRPLGSFLFLGPTGVGKTELSKALSETVFEGSLIRVDMSEYMEKHSVSKMIGAPPGYVGHEDGGNLAKRVRENPYSVILFDEIEKAHPDVFNMLLQLLDDGRLTDSKGKVVNFKNTIIIMTSNIGANKIISPKNLGFKTKESKEDSYKLMKDGVMDEVKKIFKPEFLNRIDETIVFNALGTEELEKIVKLMLDDLSIRAKDMGLELHFTKSTITKLADVDKNYGARPIARKIKNEIEDVLANEVIEGTVKPGDVVTFRNCKLSVG